jgi:endonuclease/exonuclease/phosphatase family metal-dependent hydrolase
MLISVLQWNVWFQEDIRHIASLLHEVNPDIFCLQELTIDHSAQAVKHTPDYLTGSLGYYTYYHPVRIDYPDGRHTTQASGIFSRFPITRRRFAWINQPSGHGGAPDEHRAYVEATLELPNNPPLTVATTHMSYTHRFEPTPAKQAETDAVVQQVTRHPDRLIFSGDLNSAPDSPTITAISKHLKSAGPDHQQNTWTTKPFDYQGFTETELNWRLDYVFATPDLQPVLSEILSTNYSDHLPILAKFEV